MEPIDLIKKASRKTCKAHVLEALVSALLIASTYSYCTVKCFYFVSDNPKYET